MYQLFPHAVKPLESITETAPETWDGGNYDEKSDVYSFSIILWRLFGSDPTRDHFEFLKENGRLGPGLRQQQLIRKVFLHLYIYCTNMHWIIGSKAINYRIMRPNHWEDNSLILGRKSRSTTNLSWSSEPTPWIILNQMYITYLQCTIISDLVISSNRFRILFAKNKRDWDQCWWVKILFLLLISNLIFRINKWANSFPQIRQHILSMRIMYVN